MILEKAYFKSKFYLLDFCSHVTGSLRDLYLGGQRSQEAEGVKTLLSFERAHPVLVADELKKSKCITCDLCVQTCPTNALSLEGKYNQEPKAFSLDMKRCTRCAECIIVCPTSALEGRQGQMVYGHKDMVVNLLSAVNKP